MVVLIKLNEMYIEYEGREVARLTVGDTKKLRNFGMKLKGF